MARKNQVFSNNSAGTMLVALSEFEQINEITWENSEDIISSFAPLSVNDYQVATLTHPGVPDVYEIVHLIFDGTNVIMHRGKEGTPARNWPAGAKLQARVTAGMLQGFIPNLAPEALELRGKGYEYSSRSVVLGNNVYGQVPSDNGFAVMANSRWIEGAWLIAGYPVLQLRGEAYTKDSIGPAATSTEAIFTSGSMDLGVVPAWAPATDYKQGAVVQPTTPTGVQWRLDIPYPWTDHMTSGATEPALFASEDPVSTSEGNLQVPDGGSMRSPWSDPADGGSPGGFWAPQNLSQGVFLCIPTGYLRFYPTEIGFICDEHSATSAPVVSIGSAVLYEGRETAVEETPGLFASNVALSSITGPHMRHRITAMPDVGVLGFVIKLDTPAAGGSFHGRFYFKGMFAEVTDWMPPAP